MGTRRGRTASAGLVALSVALGSAMFLAPASGAATTTYSNPAAITINDTFPATPYPSTISVSGFSGSVTGAKATLVSLTHSFPDDFGVLLVGPTGAKSMLMRDACGGAPGLSGVTLTFDDSAGGVIPDSGPCPSGTYRPFDYLPAFNSPVPAPAGPYTSSMSVFKGVDPNGTWKLFIDDHNDPDSGTVAGGWSLSFETPNPPVQCSGKDATISGTAGNDTIAGTAKADVIDGGAGNDKISGGAGKDVICGDEGKDTLKGGSGKDKLLGGAGKDALSGGKGNDKLIGGPGKDLAIQ